MCDLIGRRAAVLALVAVVLAVAWPARAGARAQDDEPSERQLVARAMSTLRDRRADDASKDAAMASLLDLGTRGPKALADHLEREIEKLRRAHAREEGRILASFEKRAPRVIEARLDREAQAVVDEARETVLDNARDPELTKERIVSESDPAVERLRALLTVTTNDVWDAEEELFEAWAALLDGLDEEARLRGWWDRACAALAAHPDGAGMAERLDEPPRPRRDADALVAQLAARAELATPMSDGDRRTFERNERLGAEIDPEEAAGVRALNLRRVLLGLNAQELDLKLVRACRGHSKDMHEHGFFSHDSPLEGRETPWKRAAQEGTSAGAENIARGARTGPDAIRQWWYSPGHHRNMLGGASRTGLGRHAELWTQLFG